MGLGARQTPLTPIKPNVEPTFQIYCRAPQDNHHVQPLAGQLRVISKLIERIETGFEGLICEGANEGGVLGGEERWIEGHSKGPFICGTYSCMESKDAKSDI